MGNVYEPAEDSELLRRNIAAYARGKVLDLGTGSGILAVEASKKADKVIAVDINPKAIQYCKEKHKGHNNLNWIKADLFSFADHESFDLITFNPPYLPQDKGIDDPALYGGKKGWEIYERFFAKASDHLKPDGDILILFSSHTNKQKIEELISQNLLTFKEIDSQHIFFETLYVYLVRKSKLLKELEAENIMSINYLARGKRGVVYTGLIHIQNKKRKKKKSIKGKVAIKTKNPDSEAIGRIEHEAVMLQKLNQHKIGPQYVMSGKNYLIYHFAEGIFLPQYLEKADKKDIQKILRIIFEQLAKMDSLGINKEEMHRPTKHIIINDDGEVTMIDFERARFTEKPHNITQFSKFLISKKIREMLEKKGFSYDAKKIIGLTKKYRQKKIDAQAIIEGFLG